jgi:hypothetical protein
MYTRIIAASAVAASLGLMSVPAAAQNQSGLVNVNVSDITVRDVLQDVIADNNISAQIPVSAIVSVPIGIAANVCNISAAVLARQAADAAPCNATSQTASRNELTQLARTLQRQQR